MKSSKGVLWLSSLIAVLVLVAAATGVFFHASGAPIHFVTVREEHAIYQGSNLYAYDPSSVVREGVIWDVIDLCLTLPLFLVALVLSCRGSLRARLGLCGLLFYFFYKYMQYTTMLAFNPLFLVYVAIFALSAVAFFLTLPGIEVARLPEHISARFPQRLFIGFALAMSAALLLLWVGGRVVSYTIAGRFPDDIAGETTLVTQAFDLGMVVPLLLATAILLATLRVGIPPGWYQPDVRVHHVHHASGVDRRSARAVRADRSRRSRPICAVVPDGTLSRRAILLECARGKRTPNSRNDACEVGFRREKEVAHTLERVLLMSLPPGNLCVSALRRHSSSSLRY